MRILTTTFCLTLFALQSSISNVSAKSFDKILATPDNEQAILVFVKRTYL